MLNIKLDQVKSKLSAFLGLSVFESKLKSAGVLVSLKSNSIIATSELHYFDQVGNVETKYHVGVASVRFKSFATEVE